MTHLLAISRRYGKQRLRASGTGSLAVWLG
jgi:hypothetical protein